jgi:hypothetical protein
MKFEEKTEPNDYQRRAKYKGKSDSEQEAYRAPVFVRSIVAGKYTLCGTTAAQHGAKHFYVSAKPELNLSPRLPQ